MKHVRKGIFRKIIAVALCALMMFLVACTGKGDPKTATYGEYDDIAFYKAFDNYCKAALEEIEEHADDAEVGYNYDYRLSIESGWRASEDLNQNTLSPGERAITYSAELMGESGGERRINTLKFFMVLNEENNTLEVNGAYMSREDGKWEEKISKSEAEYMIEDIYYYN